MLRLSIAEPGRYYHASRSIIMRTGLLIEDERRFLWHELTHAERGDEACYSSGEVERSVDREAAQWAMPLSALEWAFGEALAFHEAASLLKLPESWVLYRLDVAHPAERALVQRAARS